jgi:hypothetical protein
MDRTILVLALSALLGSTGCGLITKDFSGHIKANFTINSMDTTYNDSFMVDPDSNPDVKDNRSKIQSGSGQIRMITLRILSVESPPANQASLAWGEIHIRTAMDSTPDSPLGLFESVPVLAAQQINVALDPDTRSRIANYVFVDNGPLTFTVKGQTDKPPDFSGEVDFEVEFSASL